MVGDTIAGLSYSDGKLYFIEKSMGLSGVFGYELSVCIIDGSCGSITQMGSIELGYGPMPPPPILRRPYFQPPLCRPHIERHTTMSSMIWKCFLTLAC